MPNLKAIRRRITSVTNTKQITRAMKLVSAAKLRRAQDAAVYGRVFTEKMEQVVAQVSLDIPKGFQHPLLLIRQPVKVRRIVVIAADRGLCGAFNTNLFKSVASLVEGQSAENQVENEFVILGRKAIVEAKKWQGKVLAEYGSLSDDAAHWPFAEICSSLVKDFTEGVCDEVIVVYTKFFSMVSQEVCSHKVLPFFEEKRGQKDKKVAVEENEAANEHNLKAGQFKYDPTPIVLIETLLPMLFQSIVAQAGLESKASEHAARMRAMDAATRNADELIDKLRLFYNRARQSTITTELIDIVGGSEALH